MPGSYPVLPTLGRPSLRRRPTGPVVPTPVTADSRLSVEPTEPTFDPSEHTVDEVKDYVWANPDDSERVLDAEMAGKNRTTLVAWLQADNNDEPDTED